jgi:hypothetical protein
MYMCVWCQSFSTVAFWRGCSCFLVHQTEPLIMSCAYVILRAVMNSGTVKRDPFRHYKSFFKCIQTVCCIFLLSFWLDAFPWSSLDITPHLVTIHYYYHIFINLFVVWKLVTSTCKALKYLRYMHYRKQDYWVRLSGSNKTNPRSVRTRTQAKSPHEEQQNKEKCRQIVFSAAYSRKTFSIYNCNKLTILTDR